MYICMCIYVCPRWPERDGTGSDDHDEFGGDEKPSSWCCSSSFSWFSDSSLLWLSWCSDSSLL